MPMDWRDCPGPASVHDVQLSQLYPRQDFSRLSEVQVLDEFLFSKRGSLQFQSEKTIQIAPRKMGRCDAVFMWWELKMDPDGEIVLTCAPSWAQQSAAEREVIPWRDHWMQVRFLWCTKCGATNILIKGGMGSISLVWLRNEWLQLSAI